MSERIIKKADKTPPPKQQQTVEEWLAAGGKIKYCQPLKLDRTRKPLGIGLERYGQGV